MPGQGKRADLSPKQSLFAQKYMETGNASEAYRIAYGATDWTADSLAVEASRMVKHPKVSLRIKQLQDLAQKRHEVTIDRIVAEYSKLAFLDIRKAFTEDGELKPVADLDDDTAAAVAGFEFEEVFELSKGRKEHTGRLHKIKLSDKKAALDSLGKFLGMFTDKLDLNGSLETKSLVPAWLADHIKKTADTEEK